jgi:hypothetical protein
MIGKIAARENSSGFMEFAFHINTISLSHPQEVSKHTKMKEPLLLDWIRQTAAAHRVIRLDHKSRILYIVYRDAESYALFMNKKHLIMQRMMTTEKAQHATHVVTILTISRVHKQSSHEVVMENLVAKYSNLIMSMKADMKRRRYEDDTTFPTWLLAFSLFKASSTSYAVSRHAEVVAAALSACYDGCSKELCTFWSMTSEELNTNILDNKLYAMVVQRASKKQPKFSYLLRIFQQSHESPLLLDRLTDDGFLECMGLSMQENDLLKTNPLRFIYKSKNPRDLVTDCPTLHSPDMRDWIVMDVLRCEETLRRQAAIGYERLQPRCSKKFQQWYPYAAALSVFVFCDPCFVNFLGDYVSAGRPKPTRRQRTHEFHKKGSYDLLDYQNQLLAMEDTRQIRQVADQLALPRVVSVEPQAIPVITKSPPPSGIQAPLLKIPSADTFLCIATPQPTLGQVIRA